MNSSTTTNTTTITNDIDDNANTNDKDKDEDKGIDVEDQHHSSQDNNNPVITVVCIGTNGSGKSTLVGHLMSQCDQIDKALFESTKKAAKELGKEDEFFSFLCNRLSAERERGITIDVSHFKLFTENYRINLYDTPGLRDFIKNMITVASQADAAILVVSATDPLLENSPFYDLVFTVHSLHVKQVIVVINKMDLVQWNATRYEEIKSEVSICLSKIGYTHENVHFVPASALQGENLTKKSDKFEDYKGATLFEALNNIQRPIREVDKPLRFPIRGVYVLKNSRAVILEGTVHSGILYKGMKIKITPDIITEVVSLEMFHKPVCQAFSGDSIGFHVALENSKRVFSGMMVGDEIDYPPQLASSFIAKVVIHNHPGAIVQGYCPVFDAHTARVAARFQRLIAKIDPQTEEAIEHSPRSLKRGDAAIVEIVPTKRFCIESFSVFSRLGCFVIRDMRCTVGYGVVKDVLYE
eukprot:TRINITY_DN5390_c0_g1_i1.p1 TRINITY_DN5390_c0_g1~~TRINITY_DN5390_c0_g1_i1.p1  ORF type:complete len:468 (-),score=76.91 TRINITY_DN5390_c0_g1_i1:247-1650(-)